MRTGERNIYIAIAVLVVGFATFKGMLETGEPDPGIPFYTTLPRDAQVAAESIYKRHDCSNCHTLWLVRNWIQSVPAPALDGIGSLKTEDWLYDYLSTQDPQSILPSRLKAEYRMPSYAHLPEDERRLLAAYLASLKVEDWYLEEIKRAEYEVLTGLDYRPEDE
jgi:L-cysteine S-thiosulfotransferase